MFNLLSVFLYFLECPFIPQAGLELAVERLKQVEGSGTNGRDWIVKEFARVSKEVSALEAAAVRREEAVLEVHRTVSHRAASRDYKSIRFLRGPMMSLSPDWFEHSRCPCLGVRVCPDRRLNVSRLSLKGVYCLRTT